MIGVEGNGLDPNQKAIRDQIKSLEGRMRDIKIGMWVQKAAEAAEAGKWDEAARWLETIQEHDDEGGFDAD